MPRRGEKKDTVHNLALAMELLDHGTIDELQALGFPTRARDFEAALSRLPQKIVISPWFGFSRVPADPAPPNLPSRMASAKKCPELVRAILEMLFARGEVARAAHIILAAGGAVEVSDFVIAHCFDFINHGFREMVESYVFDDAFKVSKTVRTLVSVVLNLLLAAPERFGRALVDTLETLHSLEATSPPAKCTERERILWSQARAFIGLVTSWATSKSASSVDAPSADGHSPLHDPLTLALQSLSAIHARRLEGAYEEAYFLLRRAGPGQDCATIVSSLAAAERFVCATVSGRAVRESDRALLYCAIDFLDKQGFHVLSHSAEGYSLAALALPGETGLTSPIKDTLERVARHPDARLRAALRLGLTLMLLRDRSLFAAYSISRSLTQDLLTMGAGTLALAAYPAEMLARKLMGEEVEAPPPVDARAASPALLALAHLIYAVSSDISSVAECLDELSFAEALEETVPTFAADALVELVLESPWDEAGVFRQLLPARWAQPGLVARREVADLGLSGVSGLFPRLSKRKERAEQAFLLATAPATSDAPPALAPAKSRVASTRSQDPRQLTLFDPADPPEGARALQFLDAETPLLQLKLLGEFEVIVGDRRIEEGDWRRKAARLMLEILAMVPTHSLTRAELCELMWPDRDFLLSRNNLYSVVSSVRDALGCREGKPPYLVIETGRITLNPKLVMVDVDEFEALCKEVLSHTGDRAWRLSLCRHVSALYAGGLRVPPQDVRGDFAAKQRSLQALYLDVQVEASDLALKEGLVKEALWFAQAARESEPLREDVVGCYLRSLAADGRVKELEDTYSAYRHRLERELQVLPSARMEALHRSLARWLRKNEQGGFPGDLDEALKSRA